MTDPAQPPAWGAEVPAWQPEVPPWAPNAPGAHATPGVYGAPGAHGAPGAQGTPGVPGGYGTPGVPGVPGGYGAAVPRGLQEHHEGWALGQPLPAEPALMREEMPRGVSPATGETASGDETGPAGPQDAAGPSRDDRWAMACYLGAIFFWLLAPLVIYRAKRNSSIFVRSHAAQAFNLTFTATLFAVSGAIVGGLLALDSRKTAIVIMGPVLLVFWIVVLTHLIRAASSASRDDFYEIPGWLCVPVLQ
jgi:uncharacterized Tic20 family protein